MTKTLSKLKVTGLDSMHAQKRNSKENSQTIKANFTKVTVVLMISQKLMYGVARQKDRVRSLISNTARLYVTKVCPKNAIHKSSWIT